MRAMRPVALGMLLTLVASSSCIGGGGGGGSFLIAAVTGAARLLVPGGDWEPLTPGRAIEDGTRIQVGDGGLVEMTRGDQAQLEVRPARRSMAEVTIAAPDRVAVDAGDLLVTSPETAPIGVESSGITANGLGVFRFDRSLSVRVAVYDGQAVVAAPSGELRVPSLRQGVIAGRALPRATEPLRFDATDPWDARLLAEVIDLDLELDAQRRGYEAEFGRRMRSTAPLREVAGSGQVFFARPYLSEVESGDVLIAFVIALLVEERDGTARRLTFRRGIELFQEGATWGLIAVDNDLEPAALTDAIVRAIALRTGDVEPGTTVTGPPTGSSPPPTTTQSPTASPRPSSSPRPSTSPRPTSSPSPSPSQSSSPSPSPSPSECPLPIPDLCPAV